MSLTDDRTVEQVTPVVPDGVEYVPVEVRELARGIAADLRKYGHWQGEDKPGAVCILIAPTYTRYQRSVIDAGGEPDWTVGDCLHLLLCGSSSQSYVPLWNDTTPTADVLSALDRIAEGLVER